MRNEQVLCAFVMKRRLELSRAMFSFQDGLLLRSQPPRHQYSPTPHIHVLPVLGRDVLQRPRGQGLQSFQIEQLLPGHAAAYPLPVHHARPVHDCIPPAIFRLWPLQVFAFEISPGCHFLPGVELGRATPMRFVGVFSSPNNPFWSVEM